MIFLFAAEPKIYLRIMKYKIMTDIMSVLFSRRRAIQTIMENKKRICIKDLAPFASAEDLSDERESPSEGDTQKATKLTEIAEEKTTPVKTTLLVRNTTPRIDISRASSSSHPEDSSPEREMFSGTYYLPNRDLSAMTIGCTCIDFFCNYTLVEKGRDTKLEIVFGEEIASELHSSTEELSFYDNTAPDGDRGLVKKRSSQTTSVCTYVVW